MFLPKLQLRQNHQPLQVAKQSIVVRFIPLLLIPTSMNLRRRCQPSNLSLLVYDLDGEDEEEA